MGEIRAFREEHAHDVAGLYLREMSGRSTPPSEALRSYFCEILLKNPWASPEVPSLVYLEGGRLVAFLGVIPRVMEFRGRPVTVAVTSQFMVDRKQYRGPAALELMRRFLDGPQDLSYCDGVGEEAYLIWQAAGAHAARLYSLNWLRLLRPLGTLRSFGHRTKGVLRLLAQSSVLLSVPGDALLTRVPGLFRPRHARYESSQVPFEELLGAIREVGWREPLRPAYEAASFHWLMCHMAGTSSRGKLRTAVVRAPDGRVCGWYIYYANPGGAATVFQIGVRRRDQFDGLFSAVLQDAWDQGAAAVKGLAMPQFLVNLTGQLCFFRQSHTCVVFRSRNPQLEDCVFRGEAALSGLDGERWAAFATCGA